MVIDHLPALQHNRPMQAVYLFTLLAAICGLVAASLWVSYANAGNHSRSRAQRLLEHSAIATAGALASASIAALLALYVIN